MKQLKQLLLVMAIALTGFTPAQAQTPTTFTHYSEWMANTQKSYVYKKGDTKDYWRYDDGLMYESILDTYEYYKNGGGDFTDATLKNAVKTYIDECIKSDGTFKAKYESTTLDDIRPARMVYKYYKLYGGSNLLTACQTVMNCSAFSDDCRVISHSTGYPWQHKSSYAHQVWLDGIFMGIPYWTLVGPNGIKPNTSNNNKTSWTANDFFDDAYNQMLITYQKTYEPEIGLWCHAWDEYFESTTKTPQYWSMKNGKFKEGTFKDYHTNYEKTRHEGRSSHCWGRAAGWFAMAIMETMDNITAVDANYTHLNDLQTLFQNVIDAVWEKRDPTTGMWRCVLDVDDSTGDYKTIKDATGRENYLEATCSAMFTYCLLHGVAKGYLPASYLDKAKSSYQDLISTFITTDGGLKLNKCMEVGGLGGTTTIDETDYDRDGSFAYYTIEKTKANDSKGVGPFIWASLEAEKIGYNRETNSFSNNTMMTFAWSKASDEVAIGDSYTSPTFTGTSYGGTTITNSSEIDFESDNTAVATVGTDGTVTLVGGAGTANITAELKSGSSYLWSGDPQTYTVTVTAPDVTAPTLSSQSISNNATNVATSGNIVLTFDENVACTTNATLTPNGGAAINLTPTVSGSTVTYSYSGLSNSTSYTFNLAANSVADLAGNKYANAINITFTTIEAGATTEATISWTGADNTLTLTPTYNPSSDSHLSDASNSVSLTSMSSSSSSISGYLKPIYPSTASSTLNENSYASISFNVASGYTFTPTSLGMTLYSYGTSERKAKVVISDNNGHSITSDEWTASKETDKNISFSSSFVALSGNVTIKLHLFGLDSDGSGKRCYIKYPISISGTVSPTSSPTPTTYSVTYNGNGNTSGTAPTDNTSYSSGATVTVLGNTGNLVKTGYTFNGWNTAADGNGTDRAVSSTFPISANTELFAKWTENTLPAAPEFSPEEGNVNGGTEVSITSTDATTIYYQISESSTPLAIGNSGWSTYSSAVVLPNITGTRYLHAYGVNTTGNSTVSTAIYTLTENAGGGSTTATYTFDDGVALATDWDVTTTVPSGGNAVCEITNSLTDANFSPKNNNYLGLAYLNKSGIGITVTTKATYSNITKISIDAVAGDNSKPTFAAYIVTASGDAEVFAAIGSKDGFETGGTNNWGNKTVTLGTPLSGKLKIVTTASSSGKYAALDNIAITTEAGASTKVATPTITGTTPFASNTNVTISCGTAGATIYYTTNGDTPTTSSTEYSAPFNVSATTTVKAIAVKDGMTNSNVAEETFTLDNTKPTVTMTTPATTTDVAINTSSLVLTVSEDITDVGGTIAGTFDGNAITFTRTNATTLTYSIPSTLTNSKTYNVTLSANQIQDAAGNQNDATNFSFTTVAAAPSPSSDETELYTFSMSGSTINFANGDSDNFSITNNKSCEFESPDKIKFRWHKDANTYGEFTLTSKNNIPIYSVKLEGTIEGDQPDKTWGEGETVHQNVAVTNGTYAPETMTWTANSNNVTSVTFTNNFNSSANGNIFINKIIITYLPITTTISSAKYATYVTPAAIDFTQTEGITAFKVTATSPTFILTEVNDAPANTPVVLKGEANTYTLHRATEDLTSSFANNQLRASDGTVVGDESTIYVLGKVNGVVGFGKLRSGTILAAGKAYLLVSAQQARNFYSFNDAEIEQPITTGLNGFSSEGLLIDDDTPLYNLSGQRVSKSYKGIVIINGKKVLRK